MLTSPRFAGNDRLQRAAENKPVIKKGEVDKVAVEILQRAFVDLGFGMPKSTRPDGTLDGIFGGETESTVRTFQAQHGLEADGIVGRNTLNRLDALFPPIPQPQPSEFILQVRILGGLTPTQQAAFQLSAARWMQVIVGDLPEANTDIGVVDDIVIDARGVSIDDAGGILGQAGPTMLRQGSALPARGIMEFDLADLSAMESAGTLTSVILHEMGHVLGIGTLWDHKGLLKGEGGSNPVYEGPNAKREFAVLNHGDAEPVPLENTGGPGTRDSHWRESVFGAELMTGFIGTAVNPLSRLSVAALEDLGYSVNYGMADAYSLPSASAIAALAASGLGEKCEIRRPIPQFCPS